MLFAYFIHSIIKLLFYLVKFCFSSSKSEKEVVFHTALIPSITETFALIFTTNNLLENVAEFSNTTSNFNFYGLVEIYYSLTVLLI